MSTYPNAMAKVFRVDVGDIRMVPRKHLFQMSGQLGNENIWNEKPAAVSCRLYMPETSSTDMHKLMFVFEYIVILAKIV